jgi:uncharacterized protein (TIGR00106 family)
MSVIVEFSLFPIGKGEDLSQYVARVVPLIEKSGLPFSFGPMGTSIEGEYAEVMGVVQQCVEELRSDCDRVYLALRADCRAGESGRLRAKVKAVEDKVGHGLGA